MRSTRRAQWYWRADFVNELSDAGDRRARGVRLELPTPHSTMHLYPIDGAAHRVGQDDTAFSYRDANWAEVIVGVDPDPARTRRGSATGRRHYWRAASALGGRRLREHDDGRGRGSHPASYRGNYDRLGTIKATYDPGNLFRVNQNIRPR